MVTKLEQDQINSEIAKDLLRFFLDDRLSNRLNPMSKQNRAIIFVDFWRRQTVEKESLTVNCYVYQGIEVTISKERFNGKFSAEFTVRNQFMKNYAVFGTERSAQLCADIVIGSMQREVVCS